MSRCRRTAIALAASVALAPQTAVAGEDADAGGTSAVEPRPAPSKPAQKKQARLLLDRAAWCVATACGEEAESLLAEARAVVLAQPASAQQVMELMELARLQAQLRDDAGARSTLQRARRSLLQVRPSASRLELKQRLALGFAALGEGEIADAIEADVRTRQDAIHQASRYPFPGGPGRVRAGLAVSGTSFDEVTANGSASLSVFKPWINQDLTFDFIGSLSYDSGRDVNKLRPNVNATMIYRSHMSDRWNWFAGNITSVNSGLIASSTDDADTSVLNATYLGPGLNIWRGKKSEQFLDLLVGFGARYEYEEIDLQAVRDELTPTVALILYGRGLSIGKATLSPTVGVGAGSDNLDSLVMYADVNLNIPFNDSWAWSSRVLARYTSDQATEKSEKLNYQYFTGLTYTFKP